MLAATPPMGWNSWNAFTNNINEQMIRETADAMVASGLRDAGYEYLVIDDCWSERSRGVDGRLVADHEKFPNGMRPVADYVHAKGLKFGMYSCCGVQTCAGYPGSFGHEFDDANYFAEVGIDLLKYDNCYHPSIPNPLSYSRMALALKASGREILFSACNWGTEEVWRWARSVGAHMYRSTGDITDTFASVRDIADSQRDKLCFSAPGCFNDVDMLIAGLHGEGAIGFGHGCTDAQYRFHFALWCFYSAPLMLGCDLRSLTAENKALITHPDLLRIDQDAEARPPIFVTDNRGHLDCRILFKHLSDNEYAIGLFNPYDSEKTVMLPYYEIGLDPLCGYGFALRDVFSGETSGPHRDCIDVQVPAGDCRVFLAQLRRL